MSVAVLTRSCNHSATALRSSPVTVHNAESGSIVSQLSTVSNLLQLPLESIQNSRVFSGLSINVLNAAGLSKQHAVEHLAADLSSYGTDVAVVTETLFGAKHSDNIVSVPGCIAATDVRGMSVDG